ncbi:class E sortase [Kocuria sp. U4B]
MAEARGRGGRLSAVQVAGELLLTAGVVVGLFVVWQLWWTNLDATATQQEVAAELAQDFGGPLQPTPGDSTGHGDPVVAHAPGYGQGLGIMYIPRFGDDYARPVMEGTGTDVLDALGLGHYQATAMPGGIGNFAVAGHRQTHGRVLDLIHTLTPGDRIHVRTAEGYYTYAVESTAVVAPTETRVIAPDPQDPGAAPTRRLLTLTSCHPRYGDAERYIVHAALASWRPARTGPPAEIAAAVAADTPRS